MQKLLDKCSGCFRRGVTRYAASASDIQDKIGVIGLGQMGSRMAANLLTNAGQALVVCDERAEAMHNAAQLGAETASTPAAVASTEGVRVILSMLPSSKNVQEAYLGPRGVAAAEGGIRASLLIDCSTINPVSSRQIAQAMQAAPLHSSAQPFRDCGEAHPAMIDAPVSGGVTGASAGTLTFMVGGSRAAAKAAEPYLRMMGKHVLYCGKQGNGQAAKISNNLALAIQMAATAEAMAFGISLGLDPKTLAGIFNTSSARCWSSDSYNPVPGVMEGVPASRDYEGGFALAHMVKDLNLALAASKAATSLELPMGRQALDLYTKVAAEHPQKDFGAIFKHFYS